jgi:hypothetical protein
VAVGQKYPYKSDVPAMNWDSKAVETWISEWKPDSPLNLKQYLADHTSNIILAKQQF